MMKRNYIPFWIALVILMALVVILTLSWIQSGVATHYQSQQILREKEARRQLLGYLNDVMTGRSIEDVKALLRKTDILSLSFSMARPIE